MLALPARWAIFIGAFAVSGGASGGSAPARPPVEPADVGLENRRVAAFVIMRSGGASAGAALAGAGSALGAEPNGLRRLDQPGPAD
jgi:hypothetical protein